MWVFGVWGLKLRDTTVGLVAGTVEALPMLLACSKGFCSVGSSGK